VTSPANPETTPTGLIPVAESGRGEIAQRATVPEGAPRAASASALSFASLSRAIRYRWPLALAVGIGLGAGLASATWLLMPTRFTAYALLHVAPGESQLLPEERRSAIPADRYYENTQVALIKSRPIILAALRRPKVSELGIVRAHADPPMWLEDDLKVGFLEKTDIIKLSLSSADPEEVATLVNAVKDAYLEQGVNVQRNEKLRKLDNLEKVYLASEDKIRGQRDVLRQLAESLKSSDSQALTFKQKISLEEYASLKKELTLLETQLRNAEVTFAVQKASLQSVDKLPVPEHIVDQAVEMSPVVLQKRIEVAQIEAKISQTSSVFNPGHGMLAKHEDQRKVEKAQLEKLKAEERAAIARQLAKRQRSELEEKVHLTKENLDVMREQHKRLKAEVDRLDKVAQKIGITSFELEQKRNDIEQAEAMIKKLREEKERLQVELQSASGRVTVLHPAEPPDKKDMGPKFRATAGAGIAGLLLGLFGIGFWEARARRILSKEEVATGLGMRVVGTLPVLPSGTGAAATRLRWWRRGADPLAVLDASVDGIRTLVLDGHAEPAGGQVLMITSALAREGKTMLAGHLALSLARAGKRALLVDCDFRRPQLDHIFHLGPGPGLAQVLAGEVDAASAVRQGPSQGLAVLPVGHREGEAGISQAAVLQEMPRLLDELRREYDFILLDCCPVLPVADALVVGKLTDGVLLSVRTGWSQMPHVFAAYERLTALRVPFLGAVVNGTYERLGRYEYA
jgi:capsular exopolysaccharide synthesis family protein